MSLKRAIHGGFRQLDITDEDAQRDIYSRVTGQPRLSFMTVQQQKSVVDELRRLGYKPKPSAPSQPGFRQDGRDGKHKLSGKYLPKMRALWIACYNLGVIDDRRDSALEAFAMGRQLPNISDMRFVHKASDGASVIEALKGMLARAGVAWADPVPCQPYEKRHGYKVARAQWALLAPGDSRDDFWPVVAELLKQKATYRDVTDAEWISLMNYLGNQVRRHKAAAKKVSS
ncbi:regulatory protein GemA [Rhizobium pusense]|uniref:regulatory protein GemA n=1 Tax=Agrobacterium pusense TaxID=648995 RepID=UPI002449C3B4|nr:regulatory protein GemA [Agrobacterium pusense]MDH1097433.1 regulatory protein GemA [Agrobacterium pusense]MDH1111263.1 regulatory protein GemA [Agrobacterium pusense]MDH2193466.1 regulatory protein GemA [Agrobacterium pusense]